MRNLRRFVFLQDRIKQILSLVSHVFPGLITIIVIEQLQIWCCCFNLLINMVFSKNVGPQDGVSNQSTLGLQEGWTRSGNVKGNNNCSLCLCLVFIVKKLKDHIKISKYYETAKLKTGGPCWHYIAQLSARAHKYTHLRHEQLKENLTAGLGRIFGSFCLIILRNMSMLNQLPSNRNISLNHVLDWEIQNATSRVLSRVSFIWPSDLFSFSLPDMTLIRKWTRYYQYKYSEKVWSC